MASAEYVACALLLAFVLGCAGIAATLIAGRRAAADLGGVPRAIAWMLVAVGFMFAVHLIPGVLGVLEPAAVISTSLLLVGLAVAVASRLARRSLPARAPPRADAVLASTRDAGR